jgi:hypothetical protein
LLRQRRIAGLQRFRRAVDHLIGRQETSSHFDAVAEIPAELDGFEHHFVAGAQNGDLRALV